MSSRETILGLLNDVAGPELPNPLEVKPDEDVGARFAAELAALGAELVTLERLQKLDGLTVFADGDVPPNLFSGLKAVESVWDAEIGVTMADLGVAETGSIVLTSGPGRHRLASLAPPHHIAVLSRKQIVPTLNAAMAKLGARTSVFISGPSRTADIEGVLVRGIHGPGKLWVLVID